MTRLKKRSSQPMPQRAQRMQRKPSKTSQDLGGLCVLCGKSAFLQCGLSLSYAFHNRRRADRWRL